MLRPSRRDGNGYTAREPGCHRVRYSGDEAIVASRLDKDQTAKQLFPGRSAMGKRILSYYWVDGVREREAFPSREERIAFRVSIGPPRNASRSRRSFPLWV